MIEIEHSPWPAPGQQLGPHDVMVKWLASQLNPSDFNMLEGQAGFHFCASVCLTDSVSIFSPAGTYGYGPQLPAVAGSEGVAEVLSAGSEVKSLRPGDWVLPKEQMLGVSRNEKQWPMAIV